MSNEGFDESPDPTWHLKALEEDRGVLTKRILMFLLELEGLGYPPKLLAECLAQSLAFTSEITTGAIPASAPGSLLASAYPPR